MISEKVWARKHCGMGQANSRTSGDRAQNTVPNGMKLIFPRALFLFTVLPTSCLEERPFLSQRETPRDSPGREGPVAGSSTGLLKSKIRGYDVVCAILFCSWEGGSELSTLR